MSEVASTFVWSVSPAAAARMLAHSTATILPASSQSIAPARICFWAPPQCGQSCGLRLEPSIRPSSPSLRRGDRSTLWTPGNGRPIVWKASRRGGVAMCGRPAPGNPGAHMQYRLYFLSNRTGSIDRHEQFEARDDDHAVELIESHIGEQPLELWTGGRRVGRFEDALAVSGIEAAAFWDRLSRVPVQPRRALTL